MNKFSKTNQYNNLEVLFPKIAKEWDYNKNKKTPKDYKCNSNYKAGWICSLDVTHKWEAKIQSRTRKKIKATGCPYCSNRKIDKNNSLIYKYPEIAKEWHPFKNGNKTPENVGFGGKLTVWWQCYKCSDHEWQMKIVDRIPPYKQNCPYCANKRVDKYNCLSALYPDLAEEWHPIKNGNKTPRDFVYGSHHKVWWVCKKCLKHEWITSIGNRTGPAKEGCPFCFKNISKMETIWLDILNIPVEFRNIYIKLPNGKKYKPDAYIKETNTVYEFNGDFWHGNPKKFNSNDINKKNKKTFGELYNDTLKKEAELKSYGYNIISIWESDFK
jgi:hypothetical protein